MSGSRALVAGADSRSAGAVADLLESTVAAPLDRQDCLFRERTILVPARYVESHWMHGVLLMLVQNQAGALVLVEDAGNPWCRWSSGFARAANVPSLGIVVKGEGEPEGRQKAERSLREAACDDIVRLPDNQVLAAELLEGWMASHNLFWETGWKGGAPCTM